MTKSEALKQMESAPCEADINCSINPGISQAAAKDIVMKCLVNQPDGDLPDWMARRVNQISKPVYKTRR